MTPFPLNVPQEAQVSNYLYPDMDFGDLDQDLIAVRLPNGYVIDVGWHPEHDPNGRFVIRVFWESWDRQILTRPIEAKTAAEVVFIVEKLAEHFSKPQILLSRSTTSPPVPV